MDGLRSEELQRYKNAISLHLKIPRAASSKPVDPELSYQTKVCYICLVVWFFNCLLPLQ